MQKLLIAGLGNPGPQYHYNRHNIGFLVLDALASKLDLSFKESKSLKSLVASSPSLILCKPLTFMNLSGEAILRCKDYYKIETLLVVHDELEIGIGALRFKRGGGHGGHNGLKSIDQHCGNNYIRARCGIGRPREGGDVAKYVLSDFDANPKDLIEQCTQALLDFINHQNLQMMQNAFTLKGEK
ncbi:aminoacyl-tRNA hydrolase [Helicobacter pametensis]|uniref:aminoacyl-tRNA hydrolase n=1 Tax=Helicobacter pametensis TaxID=95149 RepID=UPI0004B35B21|nr:aminoacyl-tRNA hydrolase [Helicobacter pametensis]